MDLLVLAVCRCYGANRTVRGDSFLFRSYFVIDSVSYVCVMHVCVVLSVIVQMHVFTSSLSLRHEGLVSQPPTMAAHHEPRLVAKSGTKQHMVKMVFCTCTACV